MKFSKFKIVILIALVGIQLSCKTAHKFTLSEPYYFLGIDSDVPMIEQKGDSIFNIKCHVPFNCTSYANNKQIVKKIEIVEYSNETYLLKTISDTATNNKRYWQPNGYWIVKILDNNRIRQFSMFPSGVQDIDVARRIFLEAAKDGNSAGYTLYTKAYLEQLNKNPSISNVGDVDKLLQLLMSAKYKKTITDLAKERRGDIYGAGSAGELYTLASIELGFNPVGAGIKIDSITNANSDYFSKKYGL